MVYPYYILPIVSFILALFLSIVVLFKNSRNKINLVFSAMSFCIAFWIFTAFMADVGAKEEKTVLFWNNMAIIGPSLVPPLFLWFSFIFPGQKREAKSRKIILLFLPSFFLLILSPTRFNTKEVRFTEWGTDFTPGPLYLFLLLFLVIYMGIGFWNLIKKYKKSKAEQKAQIKYLFLGFFITLVLGATFNLILPFFFSYGRLSPFGAPTSFFFVGFVAYAIIKKELFGIKVILTQLLVIIFAILLLVEFCLSKSVDGYIRNGILFLIFLFFGYLSIKSIFKEMKDKETIEKLGKKLLERETALHKTFEEIAGERGRRLGNVYMSSIYKDAEIDKLKARIYELEEKLEEKENV